MNNKFAIESLAMDLKRMAIGYYRGSDKMANRFKIEAFNRMNEIDISNVQPYIKKILIDMNKELNISDKKTIAEYSLMYSTLLQNYCIHFLS